MPDDEARNAIQRFLADLLDLTGPVEWSALRYQRTPEWDSLVQMALVGYVEEHFGIGLSPREVLAMDGYDQVIEVLAARGIDLA